jgi:hypothetical protein
MSESGRVEFGPAICFQDARQEMGGLRSLMGVLPSPIVIYNPAGSTDFSFATHHRCVRPGPVHVQIIIDGTAVKTPLEAMSDIVASKSHYNEEWDLMVSPQMTLEFNEDFFRSERVGVIQVRAKQDDGEWETLRVVRVKLKDKPPEP